MHIPDGGDGGPYSWMPACSSARTPLEKVADPNGQAAASPKRSSKQRPALKATCRDAFGIAIPLKNLCVRATRVSQN